MVIIFFRRLRGGTSNSYRDFFCSGFQVRRRQRCSTVITPYHLRQASERLGVAEEDVRHCVRDLGGTIWDDEEVIDRRLVYVKLDIDTRCNPSFASKVWHGNGQVFSFFYRRHVCSATLWLTYLASRYNPCKCLCCSIVVLVSHEADRWFPDTPTRLAIGRGFACSNQ